MTVLGIGPASEPVLVTEPGDTPDGLARIRARAGGSGGAVVVEPTPDIRERFWVYRDLLASMGAMPEVHPTPRNASALREQALGRLAAWPTKHLIITRAQMVPVALLAEWIDVGATAGKQVWVVAHVDLLNQKLERLVDEKGMRVAELAELLEAVPKARPVAASRVAPSFPRVPRTEFPLFLATCEALLDPAALVLVRELFDSTLADVGALIDDGLRDPDELAAFLREQVRASTSTDEVIVRTRAAQVAAFSRGMHLKVRIETVVGSSEWAPRAVITPDVVDRLLRLPSNHHAAAAAITLMSAVEGQAIAEIDVDDVAPDGSTVLIRGDRCEVPESLRPIVAAQRWTRVVQGAEAADPFFMNSERSGSRKSVRASGKGIQRLLVTTAEASGLPLSAAWTSHEKTAAGNWATRTGVSIQEIQEAAA